MKCWHESSTYSYVFIHISKYYFFPGPLAFCKKAVERVNSEKNILNSSVCVCVWGKLDKIYIYVHHQIGLNELINMMYFILTHIFRVIDENVCKMVKNGNLWLKKIYHLVGHKISSITVYFIKDYYLYFSRY